MPIIEWRDEFEEIERKQRTITIDKKKVYADVDNLTQKYGDGMQFQDVKKENAYISDTVSQFDIAIIQRCAEFRASELWMILSRVISKDGEVLEADNSLMEGDSFVYTFDMPVAFKDNKLKALAILMHRYILWGILYDWYMYLGDERQAKVYKGWVDKVEEDLKDMVMVPSHVKKPLQPFGPARKLSI